MSLLGAAGVRSLVLSIAITSQLTGGADNIHPIYKVHESFPEGDQVCTREKAGPRADIYCKGRILESVMALRIYNDSKTFVDMPLIFDPQDVIDKFDTQFPDDDNITKEALSAFIAENFGHEGEEMEECELPDWSENPPRLAEIQDETLRQFAYNTNGIWKRLCRQFRKDIGDHEDRFSLIYVPGRFIVPGGRFRGMTDTTRSILTNFAHIVETVGFIPNGGRIYYLARSQPPMLIPMFYEYLQATGDIDFVQQHLPTLEKEFEFWNKRRNVSIQVGDKNYMMYQYRAESNVPRPESFREDVETTRFMDWKDKAVTWKNLASAAEAGYDFSSRWFQNFTNFTTIDTTNVVEVDLNSFMCWNMELLSHFYAQIPGGEEKEQMYREKHVSFKRDFQKVFWVDKEDGWFDYNLRDGKNSIEFYPSNLAPMFTRCYDTLDQLKSERAYARVKKFGAFGFDGGIPTSMHTNTGQQWDFPNAWSPLVHMIIDGLRRSESPRLQEYGFEAAKVWIRANYKIFNRTGVFWEKYSVDGNAGSGGEYVVQAGFGWSNGVVLDLLTTYADRLDMDDVLSVTVDADAPAPEFSRARRYAPSAVPQIPHHYRRFMRIN